MKRNVSFFELQVLAEGAQRRADLADWPGLLKKYCSVPASDRKIPLSQEDDPEVIVGELGEVSPQQVIIGHVIDGDTGIRRGSWTGDGSRPVEPASQDEFFSRVSYVQFFNRVNAFAIVGGSGTKANKKHVELLANRIASVEGGTWVAVPILVPSQRVRAKQMTGVRKAEITSKVYPMGLDSVQVDDGRRRALDELLEDIATSVGGGISVSLTLSVTKPKDNPGACTALKDMVLDSDKLLEVGTKAQITAYNNEVTNEVLDLIQHNMTAQVELPNETVNAASLQYQTLVGLKNVVADRQNAVEQIIALA